MKSGLYCGGIWTKLLSKPLQSSTKIRAECVCVRDKDRGNETEILSKSERLDGPDNTWHSDAF